MEPEDVKVGYNPKPVAKEVEENPASLQYKSTQLYEKPLFQKQTTLNFPEKIWERLNRGEFSVQICSKCHHCR